MPKHTDHQILPYTPQQLFQLVADVEKYPEFLPWCLETVIHERSALSIKVDLVVGLSLLKDRFTSKVLLDPYRRIDVQYTEGPFQHLVNYWAFHPHGEGCILEFFIDFEFRNFLARRMMNTVFGEAAQRMIIAFQKRANQIYAKKKESEPSLETS